MRKHLSLLLTIAIPAIIFSQTASKTILEADKLYKEKSYMHSMQMLDKAKKEIESIYLEGLIAELLPSKIEGYTVSNIKDAVKMSFVSGNTILISQIFKKEKQTSDTESNSELPVMSMPVSIIINITNSANKVFEITESYNSNNSKDSFMPSPVEFKDYRAVLQYEVEMKQGTFMAIIGAATLEIFGQGINSTDELLEIANTIELDKIIKSFGK